jgi:hypothetical protein
MVADSKTDQRSNPEELVPALGDLTPFSTFSQFFILTALRFCYS